jgi:TPR repeat protein
MNQEKVLIKTKAFEIIEDLAEKEYLNVQYQLGYYYSNGIGTEINNKNSLKLYKIAAKKGHSMARNNLCNLYGNVMV